MAKAKAEQTAKTETQQTAGQEGTELTPEQKKAAQKAAKAAKKAELEVTGGSLVVTCAAPHQSVSTPNGKKYQVKDGTFEIDAEDAHHFHNDPRFTVKQK